jgi:hypothetical protein
MSPARNADAAFVPETENAASCGTRLKREAGHLLA